MTSNQFFSACRVGCSACGGMLFHVSFACCLYVVVVRSCVRATRMVRMLPRAVRVRRHASFAHDHAWSCALFVCSFTRAVQHMVTCWFTRRSRCLRVLFRVSSACCVARVRASVVCYRAISRIVNSSRLESLVLILLLIYLIAVSVVD
jgi:hypothetical protein